MPVRELQALLNYNHRGAFLEKVINPLIVENIIYRNGSSKSPKSLIVLR